MKVFRPKFENLFIEEQVRKQNLLWLIEINKLNKSSTHLNVLGDLDNFLLMI